MTEMNKLEQKFLLAGVPKKWHGLHLESPKVRLSNGPLDWAHDYLENLDDNIAQGIGANFRGEPGRGKSMLGAIIVMEAIKKRRNAVYFPAHKLIAWEIEQMKLMDYIKNVGRLAKDIDRDLDATLTETETRYSERKVLLDNLQRDEVELLVLDDLGNEHGTISAFAAHTLEWTLRARSYAALPSITTSNHSVPELIQLYRPAFVSFLAELGPGVMFRGKDFRQGMFEDVA